MRSGVVAEVWNLSVEGTHEYIANGVLSFNSLRNAAMRFGLALDLWAKGDLIGEYGEDVVTRDQEPAGDAQPEAAARQAKPAAKKAATAPRKAATPPPAKKAAQAKPVAKKAATPPPRPAPAPPAAEGPEDPNKLFRAIPKELRQEAMAELTANPVEADEGVIGLWPFPTDKTRGENGEPISEETLEFVLGEAVDTLRAWATHKGIEL